VERVAALATCVTVLALSGRVRRMGAWVMIGEVVAEGAVSCWRSTAAAAAVSVVWEGKELPVKIKMRRGVNNIIQGE